MVVGMSEANIFFSCGHVSNVAGCLPDVSMVEKVISEKVEMFWTNPFHGVASP